MAFTNTLRVTVGNATKKTDIDNVALNTEFLQTLAHVDHDFTISTGTGKHKTVQFLADSTYNVGSATVRAATVFTDVLGDSGQYLKIASTLVIINDTSNANMTGGITLNVGTATGENLTLKASDVTHGMTSSTEADTCWFMSRSNADVTDGGFMLKAFTVGNTNPVIDFIASHGGTPQTTDTSSSTGVVRIYAQKRNGTTVQDLAATENGLTVYAGGGTRLLVKGNGDIHVTNTTLVALDDLPDALVMRAGRAALAPEGSWLHEEFKELIGEYAHVLEERRIMFFERDEDGKVTGAMNNIMPSVMLAWDGLYQHEMRLQAIETGLRQLAERN